MQELRNWKNKRKNCLVLNNSDINYITLNDCLNMSFEQSFTIVKKRIGYKNLKLAMNINTNYQSCISHYNNTNWTKTIKIIGINPRITKTYWGIIKYALTFPEQGIHIMPLFESGDGSIYVQNSWKLNNDFIDDNLVKLGYTTSEQQLKLIINILHAMNKIVGFDALTHVDNFSKIVILNPQLFEWIKLNKNKTEQLYPPEIDYNNLYKEVQNIIIKTLNLPDNTFSLPEGKKENLIFPKGINEFQRRMDIRKSIRDKGYEPLPVVEHIPMRPILFDKIEKKDKEDWAVFKIPNKNAYAKIFGAITPYKLYNTDNDGFPVKNSIITENWNYIINHIKEFQKKYNFDFLRADMAHNQISHAHKEDEKDYNCPELWYYVKSQIQKDTPYFATMAESFYSTYYIDGISDMINKNFDIVLGDMNFKKLDENYINCIDDFLKPFRENFNFSPCISSFTNDSDLPEHNIFYSSNEENLARCFISLFLNLPSYMGMGFECRDINPEKHNQYSHNYIKKQEEDYEFGHNYYFYTSLQNIRNFYKKMKPIINLYNLKLLYSINNKLSLCFKYSKITSDLNEELTKHNKEFEYLFVVNLNKQKENIKLKNQYKNLKLIFASNNEIALNKEKNNITIDNIKILEFAVYECNK